MANDDPRRVYDGRFMGLACHDFIAAVEASGGDMFALAASHIAAQGPTAYRRAAIQRLLTAASVYRRLFREPDWSLAGAEQRVGRCRIDLLWSRRDRFFADELKTGPSSLRFGEQAIAKQAAAQLKASVRQFGEAFVGLRVLLLSEPKQSYWLRPDGTREPVLAVAEGGITITRPVGR